MKPSVPLRISARVDPRPPTPVVSVRSSALPNPRTPMPFSFQLETTDGAARAGRFTTAHSTVETPVFMPVGTVASVKTLTPDEVRATGARILLANTYHLSLRPGSESVERLGGLHQFMGWDGSILTDSG